MARYVVGVTGASGVILASRTLQALAEAGHEIDLIFSRHALYTASLELGKEYASASKFVHHLSEEVQAKIGIHPNEDAGASISSGTYPTAGMIIVPCSMATLAAVTVGLADSGLRRAADVTLKERRPLILVPRECPFGQIHLENMLRLSQRGATIVPPIPAWYMSPQSLEEVEWFVVGKIFDALGLPHSFYSPWQGQRSVNADQERRSAIR